MSLVHDFERLLGLAPDEEESPGEAPPAPAPPLGDAPASSGGGGASASGVLTAEAFEHGLNVADAAYTRALEASREAWSAYHTEVSEHLAAQREREDERNRELEASEREGSGPLAREPMTFGPPPTPPKLPTPTEIEASHPRAAPAPSPLPGTPEHSKQPLTRKAA